MHEKYQLFISPHNKNIINPRTALSGCNYWNKEKCTLNGECHTSKLGYKATVTNAVHEDMKKYIDLADTTFKERHSNHKRDFNSSIRMIAYHDSTELAKHVWKLKEKNIAQ